MLVVSLYFDVSLSNVARAGQTEPADETQVGDVTSLKGSLVNVTRTASKPLKKTKFENLASRYVRAVL